MVNEAKKALKRGNPGEAKRILERAILEDLESPAHFFDLADAFLDLGEWRKAKKAAEYGLKLETGSAMGHRFKAFAELQLGNVEVAFADLYVSLEFQPEHPETLRLVAGCFTAMKRHQAAIDLLTKVINQVPGYVPAYIDLVNVLVHVKDFEKAEEICGELLEMHPTNRDALNLKKLVDDKKNTFVALENTKSSS